LLFDRTMASEGPFRHRPAVEAYVLGNSPRWSMLVVATAH
jgi:hypothetical protein